MKWNKAHSHNAVAAKARRRMVTPESGEVQRRVRHQRARAKWRIQIRDLEHGDSLTRTLYRLPWPGRFVDSDGREYSARQLGEALARLLGLAA